MAAVAEEMAQALRRTPGFVLVPVELNDQGDADALAECLDAAGQPAVVWAPRGAEWLSLGTELTRLGDRLPRVGPQDALVLYGEAPLDPDQIRGLGAVNRTRDRIIRALDRPLLWCGTRSFLTACWRAMPDLWSVRSLSWRLLPKDVPEPKRVEAPFPRKEALAALLNELFTTDELLDLLETLPEGRQIVGDLFMADVFKSQMARGAVEELDQRGLLNLAFFARLAELRPARTPEIAAMGGPRVAGGLEAHAPGPIETRFAALPAGSTAPSPRKIPLSELTRDPGSRILLLGPADPSEALPPLWSQLVETSDRLPVVLLATALEGASDIFSPITRTYGGIVGLAVVDVIGRGRAVILIDELDEAPDPEGVARTIERVAASLGDNAVVVVSHRPDIAQRLPSFKVHDLIADPTPANAEEHGDP